MWIYIPIGHKRVPPLLTKQKLIPSIDVVVIFFKATSDFDQKSEFEHTFLVMPLNSHRLIRLWTSIAWILFNIMMMGLSEIYLDSLSHKVSELDAGQWFHTLLIVVRLAISCFTNSLTSQLLELYTPHKYEFWTSSMYIFSYSIF